mmetsp:Transcript_8362/g.21312  ORF Transcript_8362/g.21312 Transcript_8362/m.21312 type:complete len:333 (+) Transcript_8362:393-1391(+)
MLISPPVASVPGGVMLERHQALLRRLARNRPLIPAQFAARHGTTGRKSLTLTGREPLHRLAVCCEDHAGHPCESFAERVILRVPQVSVPVVERLPRIGTFHGGERSEFGDQRRVGVHRGPRKLVEHVVHEHLAVPDAFEVAHAKSVEELPADKKTLHGDRQRVGKFNHEEAIAEHAIGHVWSARRRCAALLKAGPKIGLLRIAKRRKVARLRRIPRHGHVVTASALPLGEEGRRAIRSDFGNCVRRNEHHFYGILDHLEEHVPKVVRVVEVVVVEVHDVSTAGASSCTVPQITQWSALLLVVPDVDNGREDILLAHHRRPLVQATFALRPLL